MSWLRLCSLLEISLLLISMCPAQDADEFHEKWQSEFFSAATRIGIRGGVTGTEDFELIAKPVLNWSNPERRTTTGALYFWTLNARPQVALCLYPTGKDKFESELQSLSLHPLTATVDGQIIWEPQTPGVVMAPLSTTAPVAKTTPGRLLQMRDLAREFSAKVVPPGRNSISLRLLPTPIYRYPEPGASNDWVDGAVFAFVQGTDPEVLIVIEATGDKDNQWVWNFGAARMSMVPMELRFRDEIVWQTNWAAKNRSSTYFVYRNK